MKKTTLNLSKDSYARFFIVGEFGTSYYSFIDLLYSQNFSYKDCLILTGNFLDRELDITHLLNIISIIKNNPNCYSVMGDKEIDFLKLHAEDKLPYSLSKLILPNMIEFISDLPSMVAVDKDILVSCDPTHGDTCCKEYNYYITNTNYTPDDNIYDLRDEKKTHLKSLIYDVTLNQPYVVTVPLEACYV